MKKHDTEAPRDVQVSTPSRRARLQALLFTGAALGTTLAALGAIPDGGKLPIGLGE